jgi:soluble lytic murein transglycosylase-like protein
MARASQQHGIPLGILYAVGLTETGRRGALYPYALGADGQTVFAKDMNDAIANFEAMRAKGIKLIDLGCMQINHYYHGDKFTSVQAMFDPAKNVEYAARFLTALKARERTWTVAIARYNAGPNNNPAQKRYVCSMIKNMVASGFASWTRNARDFCAAETKGHGSP